MSAQSPSPADPRPSAAPEPLPGAPARRSPWPVVAVVLGNVALAIGPWFVREIDTGPVAAAFWRVTLAAPVLFAAALVMGDRPVAQARGLWGAIAFAGVAFAADLATWHIGIRQTTLANSTLFGNAAALIFPVYGFLVARAWPTRAQGIALLLAGLGGALLLGRSAELSPEHLAGDLWCLLAGVLYAAYFIAMSRARTRMAAVPALALASFASSLPLLIAAWLLGEAILPGAWGAVIGLAVLSQLVGQGLMIYALGHLSPLVVGIAMLLQPVVAASVGWIAYGERLALPDIAGAALVCVALVLVRRGPPAAVPGLAPAPAAPHKA